MDEFINYQKYLADVMRCQEMKDSSLQHEWIFIFKREAVKVANYLRSHGYYVELKEHSPCGVTIWYVGVPFRSLNGA